MLGQGKYEIKTVSIEKDFVESIGGLKVLPDYDLKEIPDDYEAVILIGGLTLRTEDMRQVEKLAKECFEKGKLLAGICDAAGYLGTIGLLNNVKHTSNYLEDLKQWAKEIYTGEKNHISKQAVYDKNVVTANGTAPLEFAREIMLALGVANEETINDWYNFHKLGPYVAPLPKSMNI